MLLCPSKQRENILGAFDGRRTKHLVCVYGVLFKIDFEEGRSAAFAPWYKYSCLKNTQQKNQIALHNESFAICLEVRDVPMKTEAAAAVFSGLLAAVQGGNVCVFVSAIRGLLPRSTHTDCDI